ncbi:cholesterol 24-hydroxylase-like [Antennarius striatus]|uniref:cholesterol 24-hydroxylase-like n=1 Tax=Antennarius striatus TaxID=241820 RepID=UPI0035B02F59
MYVCFFFGHVHTFQKILHREELSLDTYLKWAEVYGPVYRINIIHIVLINVTCPEATKEILMSLKYTKDRILHKQLFYVFGERFIGNCMITTPDTELWYKHRRFIEPAFSNLYLKGRMDTLNEMGEKLMDKLSQMSDSKTKVSMLHLFNCVTMDVLAKVALGVDLNLLQKTSPFPQAVETCLKGMLHNVRDMLFRFNPKNRQLIKEVRKACRLLRTSGAQWIKERRVAMQNGDDVPKDFLTQIIKTPGEGRLTPEDEECMLDNFVAFFIAGQETTANMMAFCLMELGRHPDILEKVKKEVDDVIGMKQDISYDHLGHLGYLSQVLKETLRLYPPAPASTRDIAEALVIDGIHVPAGVTCMLNTYVTGRMERFFKDPLTFDPDRFHPNAPKPYYCYYPFSLGPRSCLGQSLALMETKVVMAKLLQRFDFTLLPGQSFEIRDTGTLRPKGGVMCYVTHRDHNK